MLTTDVVVAAHGGALVDLRVGAGRAAELQAASKAWTSWDLTPPHLCDLELLATGGVYAELYSLQAEQFTTRVPAPKAG